MIDLLPSVLFSWGLIAMWGVLQLSMEVWLNKLQTASMSEMLSRLFVVRVRGGWLLMFMCGAFLVNLTSMLIELVWEPGSNFGFAAGAAWQGPSGAPAQLGYILTWVGVAICLPVFVVILLQEKLPHVWRRGASSSIDGQMMKSTPFVSFLFQLMWISCGLVPLSYERGAEIGAGITLIVLPIVCLSIHQGALSNATRRRATMPVDELKATPLGQQLEALLAEYKAQYSLAPLTLWKCSPDATEGADDVRTAIRTSFTFDAKNQFVLAVPVIRALEAEAILARTASQLSTMTSTGSRSRWWSLDAIETRNRFRRSVQFLFALPMGALVAYSNTYLFVLGLCGVVACTRFLHQAWTRQGLGEAYEAWLCVTGRERPQARAVDFIALLSEALYWSDFMINRTRTLRWLLASQSVVRQFLQVHHPEGLQAVFEELDRQALERERDAIRYFALRNRPLS